MPPLQPPSAGFEQAPSESDGLAPQIPYNKIFVSMLSISKDNNILVSAAICNFLLFPINKFKEVSSLATSF